MFVGPYWCKFYGEYNDDTDDNNFIDDTFNSENEWACSACDTGDCYHTTDEIVIRAPIGLGRDLPISIEVSSLRSQKNGSNAFFNFSFKPPEVQYSIPGSVGQGYDYIDASGGDIAIYGRNFGGVTSIAKVVLGRYQCTDALWNKADSSSGNGLPYITCTMPPSVVSTYNATVAVARQHDSIPVYVPDNSVLNIFQSACVQAYDSSTSTYVIYYGLAAYEEPCLKCPIGAVCTIEERVADPVADAGFWRFYLESSSREAEVSCEPERVQPYRDYCPVFGVCEPEEACEGSNQCAKGYEWVLAKCEAYYSKMGNLSCSSDIDCDPDPDRVCNVNNPEECSYCDIVPGEASGTCRCSDGASRCSLCSVNTHFKINGKCQKCPDRPELVIAAFLTALLLCGIGGYILNKKEFNLAFITIGWDYFQVLAFFSTIDVAWPTIVLDFFDVLKFFSFSIDIAAPECLSPNITFEMKWILMMLVPLTVSLIMSIYWVVAYCFKRFIRGIRRRALLHAHTDVVIATLFLMMYYLYLPLCMKVIEIFNCAELNPSDGFEYTSWTSSSCSGGICKCWEEGTVQMQLIPYAIIFAILYVFMYPAAVVWIILSYKRLIKLDQILRDPEKINLQIIRNP